MAQARQRTRLPPAERRDQLVQAAMEEVAEHGYAGLSLDGVAERAGVTRNLLYHYFPRGTEDVFVAAMQRSGEELTAGWVTDDAIPLQERLTANFGRFIVHAAGPSPAWRCMRQSRVAHVPEAHAISMRFYDLVVSSVSVNHFGTPEPAPLQATALHAFVAYAEELLDRWREEGLDTEAVMTILRETLLGVVAAVRTATLAAIVDKS